MVVGKATARPPALVRGFVEGSDAFWRVQRVQRLGRKPGVGSDGADTGAVWAGAGVTGPPLRRYDEDSR